MTVYLLHFDRPYEHAKHYIGFVDGGWRELFARLEVHERGQGARLMAVIRQAGINFQLARVWPEADRNFERKLKKRKEAPRLCLLCEAARKEAPSPAPHRRR